jgi:hypothetical protein
MGWVVNFTPRPLHSHGQFPVLTAISGCVDPRTDQDVSEEKNVLSLAAMKKFFGRRARSLITTPAELSLFHYCRVVSKVK